jgi:hypothetical protein
VLSRVVAQEKPFAFETLPERIEDEIALDGKPTRHEVRDGAFSPR